MIGLQKRELLLAAKRSQRSAGNPFPNCR